MHELSRVLLAADPAAWAAAGFAVDDGPSPTCTIGQTTIGFTSRITSDATSPGGIVGMGIAGLGAGDLDGLVLVDATMLAEGGPARSSRADHDNGVVAIDHLVVRSPDVDRTTAALVAAGLELRRERRFPVGSGTMRQSFFWLGDAILELVGDDAAHDPGPAVAWGLALTAVDLDAAAAIAGDAATPPKRAVQPGRRIMSLHGLGVPVALLTPHPKLRLAESGDVDRIVEIEVAAGRMFADVGLPEIADDPVDADEIAHATGDGRVWVVERRGIVEGWAMADEVDGEAHLAQVSVAPEASRLGLGRMLAERIHRWASEHGHAAVTLTTFVDVGFNGPLYERWGYRYLGPGEFGPGLAAIRAAENQRWPHLADRRAAMRLDLSGVAPSR